MHSLLCLPHETLNTYDGLLSFDYVTDYDYDVQ